MSLTKKTEDDKIEIIGPYKSVHIRTATIIVEDSKELSRSFHRRVLEPGTIDASDNLVDTDISGESSEIQAICNSVWSSTVKDSWKAYLIANKVGD